VRGVIWLVLRVGLAFRAAFAPAWADCGRSYGVIAAQRLRLKAIAASMIWALALASPT